MAMVTAVHTFINIIPNSLKNSQWWATNKAPSTVSYMGVCYLRLPGDLEGFYIVVIFVIIDTTEVTNFALHVRECVFYSVRSFSCNCSGSLFCAVGRKAKYISPKIYIRFFVCVSVACICIYIMCDVFFFVFCTQLTFWFTFDFLFATFRPLIAMFRPYKYSCPALWNLLHLTICCYISYKLFSKLLKFMYYNDIGFCFYHHFISIKSFSKEIFYGKYMYILWYTFVHIFIRKTFHS